MQLNEESVDAHFKLMMDPQKYGLPFRPLPECFESAEECTAFHLLFKDYLTEVPQVQKVFFYIIFEKHFGYLQGKDKRDGSGGYFLKFKPKQKIIEQL